MESMNVLQHYLANGDLNQSLLQRGSSNLTHTGSQRAQGHQLSQSVQDGAISRNNFQLKGVLRSATEMQRHNELALDRSRRLKPLNQVALAKPGVEQP